MNKLKLIFCVVAFCFACKKNSNNNTAFFPDVQVDTYVDLNLPPYNTELALPQSYVYLDNVGYRGIVLYRTINDEFVAFDRTCPYKTSDNCAYVSVDSSNFYYTCGQFSPNWKPCCNSQFDVRMGAVTRGPAERSLKQYFISRNGSTLHISNTPM